MSLLLCWTARLTAFSGIVGVPAVRSLQGPRASLLAASFLQELTISVGQCSRASRGPVSRQSLTPIRWLQKEGGLYLRDLVQMSLCLSSNDHSLSALLLGDNERLLPCAQLSTHQHVHFALCLRQMQ